MQTLRERILVLLSRCKTHNFTLSRKKLDIGETVEFAGQLVSPEGVRPNPDYLQGIRDFPTPKTVTELRSFLGMVNQLASYHPNMAKHTGGSLQLCSRKMLHGHGWRINKPLSIPLKLICCLLYP